MTTLVGSKPDNLPERVRHSYLELLGQYTADGAWACVQMHALTLRFAYTPLGNEVEHLILSARKSDFRYFDNEDGSTAAVVGGTRSLAFNLGMYALARLAIAHEVQIVQLQDRLGSVALANTRMAVNDLERIQQELSKLTRDARPLFNGILSSCEYWKDEFYLFLPVGEWQRQHGRKNPIFQVIATNLIETSSRLLKSEEELRNTVQGISQLAAGSANLSAARTAIYIGVAALVMSLFSINGVWDSFKEWINYLWTMLSKQSHVR